MGEVCRDEMRWQEGYITLIRTIVPHCIVIMKLYAAYSQSFPSFALEFKISATTCFEILMS